MPDLTESIAVQAPAAKVYALVSDLPRMREWSPECTRVTWSSRTPIRAESSRSPVGGQPSHTPSPGQSSRSPVGGQPSHTPSPGESSGTPIRGESSRSLGPGQSSRTPVRGDSSGTPARGGSSRSGGPGDVASAASGPPVGARFVGHNQVGLVRWFTFGRVVDADPGRRFAFSITFGPIPIALWAYDFTPTATGCDVTESWTDHRPAVLRLLFRPIFGNRLPRNIHGIHTTLTRLKTTAEAAT